MTEKPVSRMEAARHELLSDVADHAAATLRDYGIATDVAEQAGAAIANTLAEHWGGQLISIPKDYHFKLAKRDLRIYGEFNGINHAQLARKYNLTVRGIYKLVERVRRREVERRQAELFS